jgi:hypothetical protein
LVISFAATWDWVEEASEYDPRRHAGIWWHSHSAVYEED